MKSIDAFLMEHGFSERRHPNFTEVELLMEEYAKFFYANENFKSEKIIEELIERLEDARYIIKIMYNKIPLAETTERMSTIINEISILLNKLEPQE